MAASTASAPRSASLATTAATIGVSGRPPPAQGSAAKAAEPIEAWKAQIGSATSRLGAGGSGISRGAGSVTAKAAALASTKRTGNEPAKAREEMPVTPEEPPREKVLDEGPVGTEVAKVDVAAKGAVLPDLVFRHEPSPMPNPPRGLPAVAPPKADGKPRADGPPSTKGPPKIGGKAADKTADTVPGKVAAVAPTAAAAKGVGGVTLKDLPQPSNVKLSEQRRLEIGQILEKVRGGLPGNAEKIVMAAAKRTDKNGVVGEYTALAKTHQDEVAKELSAEIDGLASAAGSAKGQIEARAKETSTVAGDDATQAKAALEKAGTEGKQGIEKRTEAEKSEIKGAGDAVRQDVKNTAASTAGSPDPATITASRDDAVARVNETAGTAAGRLKKAAEERAAELDQLGAQQKAQYQRAANDMAGRIKAHGASATGTDAEKEKAAGDGRVEARRFLDWADKEKAAVDKYVKGLKEATAQQAAASTKTLEDTRLAAADGIRAWADSKLGQQRSWWQVLMQRVQDWARQADAQVKAYEARRNAETVQEAKHDLDLLAAAQKAKDSGDEEAYKRFEKRLSNEQREMVAAYFKSGGDAIGTVAAETVRKIGERRAPELAPRMEAEAVEQLEWAPLDLLAKAKNPGWAGARVLAKQVNAGVEHGIFAGTKTESVWKGLQAKNPIEAAALRKCYQATYGESLEDVLTGDLSGDEEKRALAAARGDTTEAAMYELHEALDGYTSDDDEKNIIALMRKLSPEERQKVAAAYKAKYGKDLLDDMGELSSAQQEQMRALAEGNDDRANAAQYEEAMEEGRFGFSILGHDEQKRAAVYESIRADVEAKAQAKGMTSAEVNAEVKQRMEAMEKAYNERAEAQGRMDLESKVYEELDEGREMQALAELGGDQAGVDAGKLLAERKDSVWADDEKQNAVLANQADRAKADIERDIEVLANEDPAFQTLTPSQKKAELERRKAAAKDKIEQRARDNMAELSDRYEDVAGEGSFLEDAETYTQGNAAEEAAARIASGGRLSDADELIYASEGFGTNDKNFRRVLEGKSKEELAQLDRDLRAKGTSLSELTEGEYTGADEDDLLLLGQTGNKTPAEKVAYLKGRAEIEEDRWAVGSWFTGHEEEDLTSLANQAESDLAAYEKAKAAYGEDDPRTQAALGSLESTLAAGEVGVEAVREEQDALVDNVIQVAGVMTGAAGLANIVWTVEAKALMKGTRYSPEEMATDIAVGVVDLAFNALTMGRGKAVGDAAREAAEEALEGALKDRLKQAIKHRGAQALAFGWEHGLEDAVGSVPSALVELALQDGIWSSDDPVAALLAAATSSAGTGIVLSQGLGSVAKGVGMGVGHYADPKSKAPKPEPAGQGGPESKAPASGPGSQKGPESNPPPSGPGSQEGPDLPDYGDELHGTARQATPEEERFVHEWGAAEYPDRDDPTGVDDIPPPAGPPVPPRPAEPVVKPYEDMFPERLEGEGTSQDPWNTEAGSSTKPGAADPKHHADEGGATTPGKAEQTPEAQELVDALEKGTPPGVKLSNEDLATRAGIPAGAADGMRGWSKWRQVLLFIRPTNPEGLKLLAEKMGLPKPEFLKNKTIGVTDLLLGVDPKHLGKVGHLDPTTLRLPDNFAALSPATQAKILARLEQRIIEYDLHNAKLKKLEEEGLISIRDGVIYAGKGEKALPFTGDHDVFDLRHADGRPMSREEYDGYIAELRFWGVNIEHGAHLEWEPTTPYEMEMKQNIIKQHSVGGDQALVRFNPDGTAETYWHTGDETMSFGAPSPEVVPRHDMHDVESFDDLNEPVGSPGATEP